jgi:hypothetical protein
LTELAGWHREVFAIELHSLVDAEFEFEPSTTGLEIGEIDLLLTAGRHDAAESELADELPTAPISLVVTGPSDL